MAFDTLETSAMPDMFGAPTYYVNACAYENAGNGNVRVVPCQLRGGLLVPQCELITPATILMIHSKRALSFAQDVFNEQALIAH